MKIVMSFAIMIACTMCLVVRVAAQEGAQADESKNVIVGVTVGAEFTDNRDGLSTNKNASFNVAVAPSFELRGRPLRWALELIYAPSILWRSNPRDIEDGNPQNDTDLYHNLSTRAEYKVDDRSGVRVGDRFSTTDDPDVQSGGTTVREDLSYIYNQVYVEGDMFVSRSIGFGLTSHNTIKRYLEDVVANTSDEDTTDAALTLMADIGNQMFVLAKGTFSDFENASTNSATERGAQTMTYSLGFKKVFTPSTYGLVEGGIQSAEYDNALLTTDDSLYANLQFVIREQEYRFTGFAGYGIFQPYVRPYSSQKRTFVGINGERTIAEVLTFNVGIQYSNGRYDEVSAGNPAGDDNLFLISARSSYKINRHLAVEVGYQFENWESDLREPFDRNTISVAVKAQL